MRRLSFLGCCLAAACAHSRTSDVSVLVREAAQLYSTTGKADDAVQLLDRALEANPDSADIRLARGGYHQLAGRIEEALKDFDAVLKSRPGQAGALAGRALLLSSAGRPADAIADATAFISLAPLEADGHLLRGWLHRRAGHVAEAFQDFEEARRLDRDSWSRRYNAGVAALAARRTADAERLFTWAAELNPGSAEPQVGLGRIHLEQARYEEAVEDFTRALERRVDADSHYHRGNAWLALGRHADALADYDRAISLRPGEASHHFGRAMARIGIGDTARAELDLAACLKRDPAHQEALVQRATMFLGQHRLDEAEKDAIGVLQIYATAERVRLLAHIYAAREEWDRAVPAYENALRLCGDAGLRRTIEAEMADALHRKEK